MSKTGFTDPALFSYAGDLKKEWYVGFRHTCPDCGVRKPYQFRFGINYFNSVKERIADGRAIEKALHQALLSGWNPHHERFEDFLQKQIEPESELQNMFIGAALDFALEKKNATIQRKSYLCFSSAIKFAKEAAQRLNIHRIPVYNIKRRHIKMLLDQIGKDRQAAYIKEKKGQQWTGNSYNKYKRYLQLLFTELLEYEAVEYNPCSNISNKIEIVTNIHRHATVKEEEIIKKTLSTDNRPFYRYLAFEELLGIRPKEILGLKVSHYDGLNQCFDLDPENLKVKIARKVPVPNVLLKYIDEIGLENHDPEDYIFSTGFLPGPRKKNRDYATRTWNELIKVGLKLNVSLYSFKGLGGEKKRHAGIGIDVVSKASFGHTSVNTSKIYLHGEGERERRLIIEQTPEF